MQFNSTATPHGPRCRADSAACKGQECPAPPTSSKSSKVKGSCTRTGTSSAADPELLAHLAAALWLVTPAFRGAFSVTLADGLAVLGIGGLLVGLLVLLLPGKPRHGPA